MRISDSEADEMGLMGLMQQLDINSQLNVWGKNKDPILQRFKIFKYLFKTSPEPDNQRIAAFSNLYPFTMVTPKEHDSLDSWIKTIISCRSFFKKNLPPSEHKGSSKGFLFRIKKINRVVGYLFGTMHQLQPEEQYVTDLNANILKKVSKCPVLLTEIKMEPRTNCVEGKLATLAEEQGVVNFGVDDCNFRSAEVDNDRILATSKEDEEVIAEKLSLWPQYLQDYFEGNKEGIEANPLSKNCDDLALANQRNTTMADNIAAFANTVALRGEKVFAAVGTYHLINTHPDIQSIPQLLENQGFTIEYVTQ